MKKELTYEIQTILDKYKVTATNEISRQLLLGVTEIPTEIRDAMLLISGVENLITAGVTITPPVINQKAVDVPPIPPIKDTSTIPPIETKSIPISNAIPIPEEEIDYEADDNLTAQIYGIDSEQPMPPMEEPVVKDVPINLETAVAYDPTEAIAIGEDTPAVENSEAANPETIDNVVAEESIPDTEERPIENERMGAVIIGADVTQEEEDTFIEERSKFANTFVFDKYEIAMSHINAPGVTNMDIYVAPLENRQGNVVNIPIIIYTYCCGKHQVVSSRDIIDKSKNMVALEVGDFHLLVRGDFENGVFTSRLFTTGVSANTGDKMEIKSKTSGAQVPIHGNGHIMLVDQEENGKDVFYEIFPLHVNTAEKAEYIGLRRSSEFLDYFIYTNEYRTLSVQEGQEMVVGWSGTKFAAEIV